MGNIKYKGGNYTKDTRASYVQVEPLSVTENGTYTAPEGTAYNPIEVNIESGNNNALFLDNDVHTFAVMKNIVRLNIPEGVLNLSDAISNATKLERVVLPQSFNELRNYGFQGCSNLREVHFLRRDTFTMYSYVFYNCLRLEALYFHSINPPTIMADTFTGCKADVNIYVPAESVDAYKSAQYWSERAAYIQAIPE